jgi:hypothetical protein
LVAANYLKYVPLDPAGHPYGLVDGNRVEVEFPDQIPFIEKGAPVGYQPPRPKDLEKLGAQ